MEHISESEEPSSSSNSSNSSYNIHGKETTEGK